MKPRRLYNLDPHEISLVKRGANLKKFLVHKALDEGPAAMFEELIHKGDWDEGKHPRGKDGKFGEGGGSEKVTGGKKKVEDHETKSVAQLAQERAHAQAEMHSAHDDYKAQRPLSGKHNEKLTAEYARSAREATQRFHDAVARHEAASDKAGGQKSEGSSTAKEIGKTQSGKAVYSARSADAYKKPNASFEEHRAWNEKHFSDFSPRDHKDAAMLHRKEGAKEHQSGKEDYPTWPISAHQDATQLAEKVGKAWGHPKPRPQAAQDPTDPATMQAQQSSLSAPAQAALRAVARILAPFRDEISDADLDALQDAIGIASQADDPSVDDPMDKNLSGPRPTEKSSAGENLDESPRYVALSEASPKEPAMPFDLSAFPQEQHPQLKSVFKAHEVLEAANRELVEKNQSLEKMVHAEREVRVMKEFTERAQAFDRLGYPKDKLAKVLKTLAEQDPESGAEFEAVLKAANAQLAEADGSLFEEQGSRGASPGGASYQARLDALIDGYVAKDTEGLTRQQIAARVQKSQEGRKILREMNRDYEHSFKAQGR